MSHALQGGRKGGNKHQSQHKVLDFIKRHRPLFPTHEEIRLHMGWSSRDAVQECLMSLATRGLIGMRVNPGSPTRHNRKYTFWRLP